MDIDKDLSKLIEFLLPIVSSYIGSLPSLLDASYWYSPNKNDSLIGSQKWHMDHEDFRQLKVFIPIDHNINDKTGSLTLINKKLTHDVFYLFSKNKKNLRRGAKFDDEDFIKVVSDKNKIISTNYSVDEVMFVDTCNCYHYGSRGSTMSRKVLQLHFTSSFSYVIPIIFRKTLDKKNLINNVISYYNNNISYNLY